MSINSLIIRKSLISITWLSFFMSINLNPIEFDTFDVIERLRILFPFLLIIILIILIKKIDYTALMKADFLILNFIFLSYFFFNIYNTDNSNINLFWPVYMFLSLFFVVSILDQKERKYLIKLTILIIFFAFIFYFSFSVYQMVLSKNFNFYGVMGDIKGYGGLRYPPRSSGLARMSLILSSFFFLLFVLNNLKNYQKLLILIITILSTITILFQSRTASFIWIIISMSIFFFYFDVIRNKLRIFFLIIVIPIIVGSCYQYLKQDLDDHIKKTQTRENYSFKFSEININDIKNSTRSTIIRNTDSNNYSSGRFQNWVKTYELIKKAPFVGNGAQADRIILNQSVHNAFLYSFISGGAVAGFLFLFIYLRTSYFFVMYLFSKSLKSHFDLSFSIILIIILNLRSILETSFAVYGIDYLIFILIFSNLSNYFSKKNE